ncbi:Gfo/Idh/MocA family protein [Gracilibacillus kekensis]|uniref:Predicted dehydrogenase n=1 Tax=Gracilibacillus kekensis TaxID=1027249 RepID=A0A1M7QTD2_9BACI|nr:Gfo/Idh/MocA family oxidoreductase [Gracilibacillus kekensis]SHN34645.1 Predicted dehydrogenase [Gracilibacillus kekensis]
MKLKVGVIGVGSISQEHLSAYTKLTDVEIYAICDQNIERAKQVADVYSVSNVYENYEEMLRLEKLDAVSICTWNYTHSDIAITALRAQKHVLIEKPLAISVEEAERIQEVSELEGKIVQVGVVRRFDPNAKMMKQFVDGGTFGDFYYAKASFLRRAGNPGGWFADKDKSGGGPLIDLGVHVIDLCWYLMGKPKPVSISANTYHYLGNRSNVKYVSFYKAADYDPSLNSVEDLANAIIRFENGASLMVDVSYTLHTSNDEMVVKLYGTKGGLEIEPELKFMTEQYDTMLNIYPQTDTSDLDVEQAFAEEIKHFVHCCQKGQKPISSVEDGVQMMRILNGIYESAEKRREITLY